jgi:anti-sigma regulatory factor (Ser/Thr protein kinase)/putative methionine-R-sulfoxide reductase with GAF domain
MLPGVLTDRSASSADDRLRRFEAVTDAGLAHLDVDELLKELLDRVCDLLGVDTAAVLLLDPCSRYLVATAARGLEEEVRQGVRIPVGKGFAGRIAAEKSAVIIEQVDHSNVLNPILREKGIASLLGVPLLVSGAVMGVLHVGTLSPRRFSGEDSGLLQLVADRVALAVHARVSRVERTAATVLQRSLLPVKLPEVAGFEFAARYIRGGDGEVGGDWYDVFGLPSGSLGIVVGDVVGRGLAAAVAMGRLRSALRAYAVECDDPAELLGKLDRQVRQFEPEVMATVLCAIVDPSGEQLRLSTAGHPPPVVSASSEVPAAVLELPIDLPVGVDTSRPRHTSVMALPPGTGVCLYTDGLIERRGRSLTVGLEHLRRVMFAGPAESVCAAVMAELVGAEPPTDDVAVLVLRRQDVAVTDPLVLQMPAMPASLQPIRTAIRRWLACVPASRDETADLVAAVGEACANAVGHAYGPSGGSLSVRLVSQPPDVVAVISDTGRWRPPHGHHRGRGITLMKALTDEMRIEQTDAGTRVVLRRALVREQPR